MLPGFNHNVRVNDRVYHVQTEDNGVKSGSLVTQVFFSGQVLAAEKSSYQDVLNADADEETRTAEIRHRMQEQHKAYLRRVTEGAYEAQVAHRGPTSSMSVPPLRPEPPPRAGREEQTTDTLLPTFAETADVVAGEQTLVFDDSDFLSSLDAEVRRHIEASDPTLPPFESGLPRERGLPSEPPPIPPQAPRAPSRMASSMANPPLRTRRLRPPPIPGTTPPPITATPAPRVSSTTPIPQRASLSGVSSGIPAPRQARFRRPASSAAATPLDMSTHRPPTPEETTIADVTVSMPGEGPNSDPNATLLELDAAALRRKLQEQRDKLKRAASQYSVTPPRGDDPSDKMTVNERSLDEVLLSYLEDE